MKHALALALVCAVVATASADGHRKPRQATAPRGKDAGARSVGSHVVEHPDKPYHVKDNPAHTYVVHDSHTNKDERHAVIIEHRPVHVIDRDPHLRVIVRGYHAKRDWGRFHRAHGAWWTLWGIKAWDEVGTVTCEAANETTGELYPASEDRDEHGWDDDTVNTVLDQALDDCYAEANGAMCGPVQPACSFQAY